MENNKEIIRGGTVITMDESSGNIVNGALLIEGNRISGRQCGADDARR